jgi:hypothetical protein
MLLRNLCIHLQVHREFQRRRPTLTPSPSWEPLIPHYNTYLSYVLPIEGRPDSCEAQNCRQPETRVRQLHESEPFLKNWLQVRQSRTFQRSRNLTLHYRIHESPSVVPIPSQMNPAHILNPIPLSHILILSSRLCLGLRIISSLQVFRVKFCTHFTYLLRLLRVPPSLSPLMSWP